MRIAETPAKFLVLGVAALVLGQTCEEHAQDVATQLSIEPECKVDDDCTLMPSQMTCCGECDPAPPFEAVPRTAVDSRLIELETDCASMTLPCEPPVCEVGPPGCVAYAVCVEGGCQVIATGCDMRLAGHAASD